MSVTFSVWEYTYKNSKTNEKSIGTVVFIGFSIEICAKNAASQKKFHELVTETIRDKLPACHGSKLLDYRDHFKDYFDNDIEDKHMMFSGLCIDMKLAMELAKLGFSKDFDTSNICLTTPDNTSKNLIEIFNDITEKKINEINKNISQYKKIYNTPKLLAKFNVLNGKRRKFNYEAFTEEAYRYRKKISESKNRPNSNDEVTKYSTCLHALLYRRA